MQIPPRRAALNFHHAKGAIYPTALVPNGFKTQCQDGHNHTVTTATAVAGPLPPSLVTEGPGETHFKCSRVEGVSACRGGDRRLRSSSGTWGGGQGAMGTGGQAPAQAVQAERLWKEGSGGMPEHLQRGKGCCCSEMSPSSERRRLRGVTSAPEDPRC